MPGIFRVNWKQLSTCVLKIIFNSKYGHEFPTAPMVAQTPLFLISILFHSHTYMSTESWQMSCSLFRSGHVKCMVTINEITAQLALLFHGIYVQVTLYWYVAVWYMELQATGYTIGNIPNLLKKKSSSLIILVQFCCSQRRGAASKSWLNWLWASELESVRVRASQVANIDVMAAWPALVYTLHTACSHVIFQFDEQNINTSTLLYVTH